MDLAHFALLDFGLGEYHSPVGGSYGATIAAHVLFSSEVLIIILAHVDYSLYILYVDV